mmetsp:Transcript_19241/g.53653  ORF Transcript_19241/g.53653 Transcript_19241/m.53653 type:complete len:404 (+) Transcript_19241:109-1320(+)
MFNSLITMYGRRSELSNALSAADKMKTHRLAWDTYTYAAILDALSKAQMPPYLLDMKYAAMAKEYFSQMLEAGVEANYVTFHSLMDCQSKAGLVEEAFAILEEMQEHGLEPTVFTFNVLIGACAKAGQPFRAKHVLEHMMPEAGIEPDVVSYNGVLGAFVKAGNIDNAYYTWVGMKDRGLLPTKVTASHMSEALLGSPAFLEELLGEARERARRMTAMSGGASGRTASTSVNGGKPFSAADQHRSAAGSFDTPEDPAMLDLHRLSQSSAQAELLRRLDWLTEDINSTKAATTYPDNSDGENDDGGLLIITGVGRHSRRRGSGVLQDTVRNILQKNEIGYRELANAGRILVPSEEIQALQLRRQATEANAKMLRGVSMRYMFLGCAVFGVLSGTYLLKICMPML